MEKRVVLIAPPFFPLPVEGYAGIERVVQEEAVYLAAHGWKVLIAAPTDSRFCIPPSAPPDSPDAGFAIVINDGQHTFKSGRDRTEEEFFDYWKPLVERAVSEGYMVHDHTHKKHVYLLDGADKLPILSTVHDANPFGSSPPVKQPCFVGVSERHADALSLALGVPVRTVYNGVDVERYPLIPPKGRKDYAVFFSRITSIKGVHEAISIARDAGVKLIIAGSDTFVDDPQYVLRIMRESDGRNVIYEGEVGEEQKVDLLSHARCMIFPTLFDEPFGIVAVEAMACGTPVVTSVHGAMPEVVGQGRKMRTVDGKVFPVGGVVCARHEEYVCAVENIFKGRTKLSAAQCRRRAGMFASELMGAEYERLLTLIGGGHKW